MVIATKQHLAALVPSGKALVLNLLRWGDEVRSLEGLDLPVAGAKGAKIGAAEMKMPSAGAELIDLTELLARSLKGRKAAKPVAAKQTARKAPAGKTASAKSPDWIEIQAAEAPMGSYREAMAAGLMALQAMIDDLEQGPRAAAAADPAPNRHAGLCTYFVARHGLTAGCFVSATVPLCKITPSCPSIPFSRGSSWRPM